VNSPVLLLLAGPDGAGKSSFAKRVLLPVTHLPFINADEIAQRRWPGAEQTHAYEASAVAPAERDAAIAARASFITETVFSHPSKVDLVARAVSAGYLVELHVLLVPEELAVLRVAYRVEHGGHAVPEEKVRGRYRRLWALVATAQQLAHRTTFYDNATTKTSQVAVFSRGRALGTPTWPAWTPPELLAAL